MERRSSPQHSDEGHEREARWRHPKCQDHDDYDPSAASSNEATPTPDGERGPNRDTRLDSLASQAIQESCHEIFDQQPHSESRASKVNAEYEADFPKVPVVPTRLSTITPKKFTPELIDDILWRQRVIKFHLIGEFNKRETSVASRGQR
jgi:hypothetical protein